LAASSWAQEQAWLQQLQTQAWQAPEARLLLQQHPLWEDCLAGVCGVQ
jgi:hypothetical protein